MAPAGRRIARWGAFTATAGPVLLVGGWTLAAARQVAPYDAGTDTISALAGSGATDRWVMTAALAGLGCCHAGTALALRPAAPLGRAVLALGGAATVLVAVFPLPVEGGSVVHTVVAGVAFGALAVWPVLATRGGGSVAWGLRRRPAAVATAVLLAVVGWFVVELVSGGDRTGLAERVAALMQALWPFAVVLSGMSKPAARADRET